METTYSNDYSPAIGFVVSTVVFMIETSVMISPSEQGFTEPRGLLLQLQSAHVITESENSLSDPNPFPGLPAVASGHGLRSKFHIEYLFSQDETSEPQSLRSLKSSTGSHPTAKGAQEAMDIESA
jgi:hypothetical protein